MLSEHLAVSYPQNEAKKTPTISTALPNSRSPVVPLEGFGQGDEYPTTVKDENCQDAKYNTKKRHQGTQTELSALLPTGELVEQHPVKGTRLKSSVSKVLVYCKMSLTMDAKHKLHEFSIPYHFFFRS